MPPADLAGRDLADLLVPATVPYKRISHRLAPLVDWSDNAESRFSNPSLTFKVLYLANTKETCFWERFGEELRDLPVNARALSSKLLAERLWKSFLLTSVPPVRCLDLQKAKTLRRIGADAATFLADYAITQAWAGALMQHSAKVDGLIYRSRLDSPEPCLAVFSRPQFTSITGVFSASVDPVLPISDPEILDLLLRESIVLSAPSP